MAIRFTQAEISQLTPWFEKKGARTRSIKDFGAVGDGTTNDTTAFQAAAAWLTSAGGGTLTFPPGIYIVGRQDPITLTGETVFSVTDATGPIVLDGHNAIIRTQPGLIVGDPALIASRVKNTAYSVGAIVAPASRNGFQYQCTTAGTSHISNTPVWSSALTLGSTVSDGSVVWTNIGALPRGIPGLTFTFQRCSGSITIRDFEWDGNAPNLVFYSGRTEVNHDGIFDADNTGGVFYSNVYSHDYSRDGFQITDRRYLRDSYPTWTASTFYHNGSLVVKSAALAANEVGYHFRMGTSGGGTSGATEPTWSTTVGGTVTDNGMTWTNMGTHGRTQRVLVNCRGEYNGRQGLTWSGGIGLMAIGCSFSYQGRGATGTSPRAGVDIEPSAISCCRDGVFINCSMLDNAGIGIVTPNARFTDGTYYVSNITLDNCTVNGTTYYSTWLSAPNCVVKGGRISGSTGPSFYGRQYSWALTQTWVASTNYTLAEVVQAVPDNGYEYLVISAGTSGASAPAWSTVEGDDFTDGGITWLNIGDGVAFKVGRTRIPSVPNGSRYRVIVSGIPGVTEPTWPTTYGATVTDGAVTWINDGPDYIPSEVTRYEGVTFEGMPHNGRGPYYQTALFVAESKAEGMGIITTDCTVITGGTTTDQRALYLTGSTNWPVQIKGLTVQHRQSAPPSNIASLINNYTIRDSKFFEGPMVTSAKFISAATGVVGVNVVVTGPNVHWGSTSGVTGTVPETVGAVTLTGTQTVSGAKTFSAAPTLSTMTPGSILFAITGGLLSQANTALFWDVTNARLGVGTGAPARVLDVRTTSSTGPGFAVTNSGTAVTNAGAVVVSNIDATTNNWAGIAFSDSTGGVSSALMGVKLTDRTNHYGEFAFATRDAVGYTERMRISGAGVGVGVTAPTARLHLPASTATANTAPLKFTSGTYLTTAEAGTMNYNNLFALTESDAVRRYIVQAVSSTKVAGTPTADGYITVRIGGVDVKLMTTA